MCFRDYESMTRVYRTNVEERDHAFVFIHLKRRQFPADYLAKDTVVFMEISAFVRSLLARRGIESDEHIALFLDPDYERDTHDPFLLAGMKRAVSRLLSAITQGERIAVYADFDCDGIPGAA